jgi:hypothetical protein
MSFIGAKVDSSMLVLGKYYAIKNANSDMFDIYGVFYGCFIRDNCFDNDTELNELLNPTASIKVFNDARWIDYCSSSGFIDSVDYTEAKQTPRLFNFEFEITEETNSVDLLNSTLKSTWLSGNWVDDELFSFYELVPQFKNAAAEEEEEDD